MSKHCLHHGIHGSQMAVVEQLKQHSGDEALRRASSGVLHNALVSQKIGIEMAGSVVVTLHVGAVVRRRGAVAKNGGFFPPVALRGDRTRVALLILTCNDSLNELRENVD